jgi:hypothetical protein
MHQHITERLTRDSHQKQSPKDPTIERSDVLITETLCLYLYHIQKKVIILSISKLTWHRQSLLLTSAAALRTVYSEPNNLRKINQW